MKAKFTRDFIPLGKTQEKKPFTRKPKINKPLAIRKYGPQQDLLKTVNRTIEKLNPNKDETAG